MSANYRDLLKYAATGIASPSMTYYDKMRASTLMGAVQTLTGIPPLSFKADGTPLISWSMKGNGSQTGTPTPDNPVMPTFCGVRTGNLFEGAFGGSIGATGGIASSGQYEIYYAKVTAGAAYTISGGYYVYAYYSGIPAVGTVNSVDNERHFTSQGRTITAIEGATWIGVRVNSGDKPMINLGSTALPYEPYGYKIPITCGGQTVPVYLGQTQTVRRIRKLVLTGEENIESKSGNARWYIPIADMKIPASMAVIEWYCSQYQAVANNATWTSYDYMISWSSADSGLSVGLRIRDIDFLTGVTLADFKSYLAQQYANGTPVTIWYVLATPETAIVNEPIAKIGDYADELHSTDAGVSIPTAKGENVLTVDTDLQPSSTTITGHIK